MGEADLSSKPQMLQSPRSLPPARSYDRCLLPDNDVRASVQGDENAQSQGSGVLPLKREHSPLDGFVRMNVHVATGTVALSRKQSNPVRHKVGIKASASTPAQKSIHGRIKKPWLSALC